MQLYQIFVEFGVYSEDEMISQGHAFSLCWGNVLGSWLSIWKSVANRPHGSGANSRAIGTRSGCRPIVCKHGREGNQPAYYTDDFSVFYCPRSIPEPVSRANRGAGPSALAQPSPGGTHLAVWLVASRYMPIWCNKAPVELGRYSMRAGMTRWFGQDDFAGSVSARIYAVIAACAPRQTTTCRNPDARTLRDIVRLSDIGLAVFLFHDFGTWLNERRRATGRHFVFPSRPVCD